VLECRLCEVVSLLTGPLGLLRCCRFAAHSEKEAPQQ
jgi:hypothetical protein